MSTISHNVYYVKLDAYVRKGHLEKSPVSHRIVVGALPTSMRGHLGFSESMAWSRSAEGAVSVERLRLAYCGIVFSIFYKALILRIM
jgi:hypothetical protein